MIWVYVESRLLIRFVVRWDCGPDALDVCNRQAQRRGTVTGRYPKQVSKSCRSRLKEGELSPPASLQQVFATV